MAFGFKKNDNEFVNTPTLHEQISAKATILREGEQFQGKLAIDYQEAAVAAKENSFELARQAKAVEQALAVLEEAGVVL